MIVANEGVVTHSELIKPLSQKSIVIEVKYGNEEKIENTISVYRQFLPESDGRGMDETPQG